MITIETVNNKKIMLLKSCILSVLFFTISFNGNAQSHQEKLDTLIPEIELNIQKNDSTQTLILVNSLYQLDTILPDDAAFYLGYTLYKFGELEAGKTALLRYVDLTKEIGKHFDSTQNIINKIDVMLSIYDTSYCDICNTLGNLDEMDTCKVCIGTRFTEQTCSKCTGTGHEKCPRCGGSGFELVTGSFQNKYVSCNTCHKTGIITCQNCKGTLTESKLCQKCSGHGQSAKERVCTHRTLENAPITPKNDKTKGHFYR